MFSCYGLALSLKKLLLSTIIVFNSVFASFLLLQPENANLSKAREPSSFCWNSALDFRCIANLTLHDFALHLYQGTKQFCNLEFSICRTNSYRIYAQMNPVLPAQAFPLIMRDSSLSQVNLLPILLCGNLHSLYKKAKRTSFHNLASEALEKQVGHLQSKSTLQVSTTQVTAA